MTTRSTTRPSKQTLMGGRHRPERGAPCLTEPAAFSQTRPRRVTASSSENRPTKREARHRALYACQTGKKNEDGDNVPLAKLQTMGAGGTYR